MKVFDESGPLNKPQWVYLFVREYQRLRPEIGERYATVHAQSAYLEFRSMKPENVAHEWHQRTARG